MQAIWLLLLDDAFVHAYVHGFLVQCGDGPSLVPSYPHIFSRLPQKVSGLSLLRSPLVIPKLIQTGPRCLIACIKHLARCLCPDCLAEKEKVPLMGTVNDLKHRRNTAREDDHPTHVHIATARQLILEHGIPPEGKCVDAILAGKSLAPHRVRSIILIIT